MKSEKRTKKKGEYSGNIIVIVGPTASGKSEVAVRLAKKYNGEVISADSRQVYRGLDIGTGKVPISFERSENTKLSIPSSVRAERGIQMHYKGIRHHLIDIASPRRQFSAARFQKLGQKALRDILRRGKTPIIAGGTGFYIDALLSPNLIPAIPPQRELRQELERRTLEELYAKLRKVVPKRAKMIDRKNKRRLIRALEIAYASKQKVTQQFHGIVESNQSLKILKIGLLVPKEKLKGRIRKRFMQWMRQGFLDEVRNLRKPLDETRGLSWKRIEGFGLNYRRAAEYLQGKISREQMIEKSVSEIYKYTKRQMTWFKRDESIHWIQKPKEAEELVRKFPRTCDVPVVR